MCSCLKILLIITFYRREYDGLPTKNGIQEYLTLLSIQQTCKYQGIRLYDFLKSGKTSIYDMSQK